MQFVEPSCSDSSFLVPPFLLVPFCLVAACHFLLWSLFTARGEVLQRHVQHQAHVSDLRSRQIFQNRDQIHQLVVVSIGEPRGDRNGVLRVEDV